MKIGSEKFDFYVWFDEEFLNFSKKEYSLSVAKKNKFPI